MSILSHLRAQARYKILTPVVMLAAASAVPALAASLVVNSPQTTIQSFSGDFTNNSTIEVPTGHAVTSTGPVDTFTNAAGASIVSATNTAVLLNTTVASFTNSGTITGGSTYGVNIGGAVQSFDNSGTITGGSTGVYVNSSVDSFTNSGTITGT